MCLVSSCQELGPSCVPGNRPIFAPRTYYSAFAGKCSIIWGNICNGNIFLTNQKGNFSANSSIASNLFVLPQLMAMSLPRKTRSTNCKRTSNSKRNFSISSEMRIRSDSLFWDLLKSQMRCIIFAVSSGSRPCKMKNISYPTRTI